VSNQLV